MFTRNASMMRAAPWLLLGWTLLMLVPAAQAATRSLEFTTTAVTHPQLTVADEGETLIFNLLGHLYRMPVTGGATTQITFGRHYNSAPTVSPDGKRIAFVSSRDGSDGNVFVMDVGGGRISQLSKDFLATLPVWSPDGNTIAYVSGIARETYPEGSIPGFGFNNSPVLSRVATVPARGGKFEYVTDLLPIKAVFYAADGRLGWLEQDGDNTAVKLRDSSGTVSQLALLQGNVDRIAGTPQRDGFYYASAGKLQLFSFAGGASRLIGDLPGNDVRFAVAPDNRTLFAGADARLWRIATADGESAQIPFSAKVKMETLVPAKAQWTPPNRDTVQLREVMTPRLSPDGSNLVFTAAGALWQQPLAGGEAKRLLDETGYQIEPAFSPDGKQLAFVSDRHGKREVRVLDLASGNTRTLATVPSASWALFPSWSPDGKQILFQRSDALFAPYFVLRVDAQMGSEPQQLAQTFGNWNSRPHYTGDGDALYYTARVGHYASLYRLPVQQGAQPQAITDLTRHVHDGLVSPDGNWVVVRRNSEIWVAANKGEVLKDADFKLFSNRGGRSFAFSPDASELVYADGAKVWRKKVTGGRAQEIVLRLNLPRVVAEPLLISNVRVLDLNAGVFSAPTSMLMEAGRISWIGPQAGRSIPANVRRLDGAGRFAIPGIMDSHTHAAWANHLITDESLIAYGVTSVRDTGSRLDVLNGQLDRGEAGFEPVPRYFPAGDIFEGLMPLWGDAFLEITTKEEAVRYVREWKQQGVNFVKIYDSLPWFLREVVAEEANRVGLPVAGHGLSVEQTVRSVNLGFTSLEHNSNNTNDDIVKLLVHSGTWLDPTLTIFGQGTPSILADADNLDEKFYAYIPEDDIRAARPGRAVSEEQFEGWKRNTLGPIYDKYVSGVKMLDGTDARMGSVFHGPSVHWSLQFFSWAGLPSIDILRMGTIHAAEVVGAADELGSLEPGKIADVVLLDADPLADVANTLKIWRVVKDGKLFDPATMQDR